MINPKIPAFETETQYLTSTAVKFRKITWERFCSDQNLILYTKINSGWINDLNIEKETIHN